jgi:hypothetical protein
MLQPRLFGPYACSDFSDTGVPSGFNPGGSSKDVNGYGFTPEPLPGNRSAIIVSSPVVWRGSSPRSNGGVSTTQSADEAKLPEAL